MTINGSLPWAKQQRLTWIDCKLKLEKRLNRGDIVNFFGVSIPQASNDIRDYLLMNERGLTYDTVNKVYVTDKTFKSIFGNCAERWNAFHVLSN